MRWPPELPWFRRRVVGSCGRGLTQAWRGVLVGLGLAAMGCAPQSDGAGVGGAGISVNVGGAGTAEAPCFVEADGRRLTPEAFAAAAPHWHGREVHLRGDVRTPYRCMGPVISALQRAGIERIGFISEPAAAPDSK
jgi:hypothetical protein